MRCGKQTGQTDTKESEETVSERRKGGWWKKNGNSGPTGAAVGNKEEGRGKRTAGTEDGIQKTVSVSVH